MLLLATRVGAFIKKQTIETFGLKDRTFEHNYRAGGFLPGVLQVGVMTFHSNCR